MLTFKSLSDLSKLDPQNPAYPHHQRPRPTSLRRYPERTLQV